jgi:hypothetical protein
MKSAVSAPAFFMDRCAARKPRALINRFVSPINPRVIIENPVIEPDLFVGEDIFAGFPDPFIRCRLYCVLRDLFPESASHFPFDERAGDFAEAVGGFLAE